MTKKICWRILNKACQGTNWTNGDKYVGQYER